MLTYEDAKKKIMQEPENRWPHWCVYLFQTNQINGETYRRIWKELGHKR